jgi:D-alanyl-D-alanine carboxypeptidase/D-alanyl-D-alanine-endopeptidase (penicillin-binding protein 4)
VLYQHNANTALIPASNVKLLTTAAALRIAGDRTHQHHPSFENWVTEINRESNNDLADTLLRRIGGQAAVRSALASLGVNSNGYEQVDGSGLSRRNRATPSTFVTLLKEMDAYDASKLFHRSLAIAGVNGTLQNRFRDTLVAGKLHGKTGTLRGVRALSGYLENPNYGTIAFSIVINQPGQSGSTMMQAIDQIVLETAKVSRCN